MHGKQINLLMTFESKGKNDVKLIFNYLQSRNHVANLLFL